MIKIKEIFGNVILQNILSRCSFCQKHRDKVLKSVRFNHLLICKDCAINIMAAAIKAGINRAPECWTIPEDEIDKFTLPSQSLKEVESFKPPPGFEKIPFNCSFHSGVKKTKWQISLGIAIEPPFICNVCCMKAMGF